MIVDRILQSADSHKINSISLASRIFGIKIEEVIQGRPVTLYGAGVVGGELCIALRDYGINISYFIDCEQEKVGV